MSDSIEITFEGDVLKLFLNSQKFGSTPIEAKITNRQRHAAILEFGSGVLGDAPNGQHTEITPHTAKALIIPVISKYNLPSSIKIEAQSNAIAYPDIYSKLKSQYRGLVGFIFRNHTKGQKPMRMVRDSVAEVEMAFDKYISLAITNKKTLDRPTLANVINLCAAIWLREIVKKTPVLTSNLKTGWTLSTLAQ